MKKIRILDWETITSGDIKPDRFYKYGDVKIFDLTDPPKASENIGDAEIVLCNKTPITSEVFENCPNIKYIGLFATGYNNVDIEAAKAAGVTVTNAPKYSTMSVAQHTFALILKFFSKVDEYNKSVHDGNWEKSRTFSYFNIPVYSLNEKTISIIGYGSIGRAVAKIADAFGMNVVVATRSIPNDCPYPLVSINEAFSLGDVVTIHCPLTEKTFHMVNRDTLSLMKKDAILINTARGDIIKEDDLAYSLESGEIRGAGLDVLSKEPMASDDPLKNAPNCVITPHIGWAPLETRLCLLKIVEDNLKAYLEGNPINKIV